MALEDETATPSSRDLMGAPPSFASQRLHTSQPTNGSLSRWMSAELSEDWLYTPPHPYPSDGIAATVGDNGEGLATSSSRGSLHDGNQSTLLNYQPSATPDYSNVPYSTDPSTISSQQRPFPYRESLIYPGMMTGSNSGYVAAMPHFLGHTPHAHSHDRPFKCDQCPQSFNRNHDLKRHKRCHLAVKPFPCNHCDKSFSRKDALKVCTTTVYE
jgi:hypothetical protein